MIAVPSDAGSHPGLVIVEPFSGFNSKARTTAARRLEPDIEVCSDRLGAFRTAIDQDQARTRAHAVIDIGGRCEVLPDRSTRWLNTSVWQHQTFTGCGGYLVEARCRLTHSST